MAIQGYSPNHYPHKSGCFGKKTDWSTPLPGKGAFYQERQSGGKCSLHSLNSFAGREVVTVNQMIAANRDIETEKAAGLCGEWQMAPNPNNIALAKDGLAMSVENVHQLDQRGITPLVVREYIAANRSTFNLPKGGNVKLAEGTVGDVAIGNAIREIDGENTSHRVILGVNGKHYITFRKTSEGKWRVIDSMANSHNPDAATNLERIQPSFASLGAAIGHAVDAHNVNIEGNGNIQLIYLTKDNQSSFAKTALKIIVPAVIVLGSYISYTYAF